MLAAARAAPLLARPFVSFARCFATARPGNPITSHVASQSGVESPTCAVSTGVKVLADQAVFVSLIGKTLPSAARDAINRSGSHQSPEGLYLYGRALFSGIGVAKDEQHGLNFIRLAADLKHPEALLHLATVYFDGTRTIPSDKVIAASYFKLAADAGVREAQSTFGFMLLNGDGVDRDDSEAARYFQLAADQGDAAGSYNCGRRLLPTNPKQAAACFERAAAAGSSDALVALATMYHRGSDVERDEKKAVDLARRAAAMGNWDGHVLLGLFLEEGFGVAKNTTEALREFNAAAEAGNVGALRKLGVIYRDGWGADIDLPKAAAYFKRAADAGDAIAANAFAFLVRDGRGTAKDLEMAIKYFEIAVEGGSPQAMNTLAEMYWEGDEIQKDQKKAAELFMMAAEKGDPHAAINVGYMYETGIGVEQSAEEALKWYELSGDLGLFEGLAAFAELLRKLAESRPR